MKVSMADTIALQAAKRPTGKKKKGSATYGTWEQVLRR
ncbi:hypothetical protein QFZ51_003619 [Chitinophaga sp. W3I9]